MKYSACIDMMFAALPFEERIKQVKECSLDAIEFWKWSNKDIDRVVEIMQEQELKLSVFNIDSSDEKLSYDLSRGILNAGRRDDFLKAICESVPVYRKLGASGMIVLIGETIDGVSEKEQINNIYTCLEAAKPLVQSEGIALVVEPLNATDRKNYFMPYSAPLFNILDSLDSPNIKMLFDIYHQQMTEGHLFSSISEHIERIGHFHVADCPGRHEPGTGEINYPSLIGQISKLNYDGYIGLEYRATKPDSETLSFIAEVENV